jgi:hypothetical protein
LTRRDPAALALLLAVALAAAACGRDETKAPPGATAGAATKPAPGDPATAIPANADPAATPAPPGGSAGTTAAAAAVIPDGAKQLVTAVVDGWDETHVTLTGPAR